MEIPGESPAGERFLTNQPTYLPIVPGMRRTFHRSYLSRSNKNLNDAIREVRDGPTSNRAPHGRDRANSIQDRSVLAKSD